jgi:hypothetical protein
MIGTTILLILNKRINSRLGWKRKYLLSSAMKIESLGSVPPYPTLLFSGIYSLFKTITLTGLNQPTNEK